MTDLISDNTESPYKRSLEAAGAKVLAFSEFGTYSGDWWAHIEYKGQTGWAHGSYGSCGGCDAFESEFGDSTVVSPRKLVSFAKEYLDDIFTDKEAFAKVVEDIGWDMEAGEMLSFIISEMKDMKEVAECFKELIDKYHKINHEIELKLDERQERIFQLSQELRALTLKHAQLGFKYGLLLNKKDS